MAFGPGSLSARRAWIEIFSIVTPHHPQLVALRKESVDRNLEAVAMVRWTLPSLSARRAWIEIGLTDHSCGLIGVALRKESVDRNRRHEDGSLRLDTGRSPQGERG